METKTQRRKERIALDFGTALGYNDSQGLFIFGKAAEGGENEMRLSSKLATSFGDIGSSH